MKFFFKAMILIFTIAAAFYLINCSTCFGCNPIDKIKDLIQGVK